MTKPDQPSANPLHTSASSSGEEVDHTSTQAIKSTPPLAPKSILAGRFEIIELSGRGGFGNVYKAKDLQLDSCIAIKVLDPDFTKDDQSILDLKNELLMLRQLNHANIIRVYEYYFDQNQHFITMDWIEGKTLGQCIQEQSLSVEDTFSIIKQILAGISYADELGIAHKDIKPDNILLDEHNHAFIADFGLSKLKDRCETSEIKASPYYAPPELLVSGEVNSTTDLYALGVVAFQMCTYSMPHEGLDLEHLITSKQTNTFTFDPFDDELCSLENWIKTLTNNHFEGRFSTPKLAQTAFYNLVDRDSQEADESKVVNKSNLWISTSGVFVLLIALIVFVYEGFDSLNNNKNVAQKDSLSIAIIPDKNNTLIDHQALATFLNYKLEGLYSVRSVEVFRVAELMDSLGFVQPLSSEQVKLLTELLQVDYLLMVETFKSGSENIDINLDLLSSNGVMTNEIRLANGISLTENWTPIATSLIDELNATFKLEQPERTMLIDLSALQSLVPVKQAMSAGEIEKAQALLNQLIESNNNIIDSPLIWVQSGEINLSMNNIIDAENDYGKAVELANENSYSKIFANGRLLELSGDIKSAEEHYLKLIAAFPKNVTLKEVMAQFYDFTEQPKKAEAILLSLVEIDPNHPRAWFLLGKVAYMLGELEKGIEEYLTKALVISKKLKKDDLRGDALNAFGVFYEQLGESQLALDYYKQALELRLLSGRQQDVAKTMNNIGGVALSIGNYKGASTYLNSSLEIYEEIGDLAGVSSIYNELGVLAEERAKYAEALALFRKALTIRMEASNHRWQAESLSNVGFAYFMLLDAEHALIYWRQAEQMYQKIGFPMGIVGVRQSIGQLELAKGNWRNAFHIFNNTKEDALALNSIEGQFVASSYLARLAFLQGNFNDSILEVNAVVEQAKEARDVRAISEFGLWLVEWNLAIGNRQEALKKLESVSESIRLKGSADAKSYLDYLWWAMQSADNINDVAILPPETINLGQQTHYIRQVILQARSRLASGQQNITPQIDALRDMNFSLNQFEKLEFLELLAIQAYLQSSQTELKSYLREAELLLRKMGSHWRSFQFDRLRAELAILEGRSAEKYQIKVTSKLKQLLSNVPKEQRESFIATVNYFDLNDGITDLKRYE